MSGIYILESLKNHSYYIGSTNDINRRLREHNDGLVKSTKNILPLELKLFFECDNLKEARRLEYKIKKLKRKDLIERMIQDKKVLLKTS